MTTNAKLHHYVPQFELSYFGEDGMVWVYDRKDKSFKRQSIRSTLAINNYYSFKLPTGEINRDIEEALSVGESIAAPILKKLNSGNWKLTLEERWEFAAYLALKWTRTPTHQKKTEAIFETVIKMENRKLASDEEKFNEATKRISKETGEKVDLKGQKEFMMDGSRYYVETDRLTSLQSMVMGLKDTYEEIFKMGWVFRYAPKGKAFITSDNSFFVKYLGPTDNPLGYGLRSPNTLTFVTLTPKVCLTLLNTTESITAVDRLHGDMLNDLNNYVGLFSNRFVISHSEALLKKVIERTKLDNAEPYEAIIEVQINEKEVMKVIKP